MASSARIDELRKKFDENPRRYFAPLANEYRKAGDLEQAIFICQEYLPQQPGHMSGHIVYGQALFETGRRQFARVLRKLPDSAFDRVGTHNKKGRVTLGEMVQSYVDHVQDHMKFLVAKREKLGKPLR